ncbi:novel immune-type receptor 7b [Ctenopharyngodon idella]|uniref:novel immune-type receptor 7b n=1 Tax=Ctenopharyngodon idella TaxID=7959 RepID=UPI0022329D94|nr:novel immune-type receptor 7b [Ctenopharyngodon idella]
MNLSATHPLMLFLIGIIFVKRTSVTLVKTVNSGTTVSFLCPNILTEPSYIAWFKQINVSLPLCIVTQFVGDKPGDIIYLNGFKKDHIEMSANNACSSLKIVNVDVSDSGFYYCGSFLTNYMKFHNKTQLVVVNETNQFKKDTANADCGATEETSRCCHIYYTLTLILSSLVLLPTVFATVLLIRLKKSNKQRQDAQRHGNNKEMNKQLQQKEQDEDLNYAALSLDKKKSRRPVRGMREEEPNVIYAATR